MPELSPEMHARIEMIAMIMLGVLFTLAVALHYYEKKESLAIVVLLAAVFALDIFIEEVTIGEPWKTIADIVVLVAAGFLIYYLSGKIAQALHGLRS